MEAENLSNILVGPPDHPPMAPKSSEEEIVQEEIVASWEETLLFFQ